MNEDLLTCADWRKSTFSTAISGGSDCVEVAALGDGRIALRDSKHPGDAVTFLTRSEMAAFIRGVKANEFDNPC